MGFGHRVYKNYDPRAKIIKKACDDVFEVTGINPLLEIALELEKIALEDEYFVKRKLYPNVDFYSGLIYEALHMPVGMFTVLFAIPRTSGWISQWLEMIDDKEQKIARPRQIYTGERKRDYVPVATEALRRRLAPLDGEELSCFMQLHRRHASSSVRSSPEDKPLLVAGLRALSPETAMKRFLSPKVSFSAAELRYLTEVDQHDHIAYVPSTATELVAVARCVRTGPDIADVAVVVGDPWQGLGLGRRLLEPARRARRRGGHHPLRGHDAGRQPRRRCG